MLRQLQSRGGGGGGGGGAISAGISDPRALSGGHGGGGGGGGRACPGRSLNGISRFSVTTLCLMIDVPPCDGAITICQAHARFSGGKGRCATL